MEAGSDIMETVLALLILCGSLYNLFALLCVRDFFRPGQCSTAESRYPPVSVLKPIKGIDPGWKDNLRSFIAQDYPEYEVLLGFNDLGEEGTSLAQDIAESFGSKVRVVVHRTRLGANPKVSNLYALVREARYPLLLISDSDMRVGRDYLKAMTGAYMATGHIGLVTALSKITGADSTGAALEALTTAADFIPSVLVARRLEDITFGLGPSMMLSKEALEEVGGLPAFADYLAEDYQIGNRLWKKGYTNVLSTYLIENVLGRMRIRDYFVHQLRWARTYKACRPKGFFGYGITHIFPFSILFLILHGPTTAALWTLAAVLALRYSLALAVSTKAAYPKRWLRWLWLLPVKDVFGLGIWLCSFVGSRVFWRGAYYTLLKDGLMRKKTPD
jgi:ceramide glucosyltransferase